MNRAALTISNLTKFYPKGVQALKGIDLTVNKGDFFGLLGPNGAGKTTVIGILSSLITKNSGKVEIFGCDIEQKPEQAKTYLGMVPQEFNFNIFEPVESILIKPAGYYGITLSKAKERARKYLQKLGLWEKHRAPAGHLSGGMKRRLMIARALVHEPEMLILDEPTAGVDIELRRSMWNFLTDLNRNGTTIILTTHYLEEAESLCRNIAIINHGNIIENTTTKKLIAKLHVETFVFDLKEAVDSQLDMQGFEFRKVDPHTIEVDISQERKMNDLFQQFDRQGISILSMRNKTNRLEELFVKLIEKK